MTDPELIEMCGRALFGDQWQRDLARALTVSDRSVRYWAAGRSAIKPRIWSEIAQLLRTNAAATAAAADLIQRERLEKVD